MAYQNFFPMQYGPQMPNLQQMAQPQIQNGGFVLVQNEEEARNYPVAYGNSVTFKNETAPYIYTKTMGFSQLDRPIFEKFRLVKEDPSAAPVKSNSVIDEIKGELINIWAEIDFLKGDKKGPKKEMGNNEQLDADDAGV